MGLRSAPVPQPPGSGAGRAPSNSPNHCHTVLFEQLSGSQEAQAPIWGCRSGFGARHSTHAQLPRALSRKGLIRHGWSVERLGCRLWGPRRIVDSWAETPGPTPAPDQTPRQVGERRSLPCARNLPLSLLLQVGPSTRNSLLAAKTRSGALTAFPNLPIRCTGWFQAETHGTTAQLPLQLTLMRALD